MASPMRGGARHPVADEIAGRVAVWLAERLGVADLSVDELHRHDEGFSWQTYTLMARWREPGTREERTRGYAIRVEPMDGLLAPYDTLQQYRVHALVSAAGTVPMAELYWLELDRAVLGMPFYAMERVEGLVPVQWRPDDPSVFATDGVRHAIGRHFVEIAARIHAIDWRAADPAPFDDPGEPLAAARAEVERWASYYEQARLVELPLMREAIAWLRRNVTCSGRLALCHGDWRMGNFMVRGGRIVAIFDWELAHVGDPAEDLAYAGLPLFRGRDPRISHLLGREEFLDLYADHTGLRVSDELFRFWTILGLLKAAASHVQACRAFAEGRNGDLRLAAMDHRTIYILRHLARALAEARSA
jgi:aminoglycoside phosphotransferase (APT) family kinase protein